MLQKIKNVITEATAPAKIKIRYDDINDVTSDKGMLIFLAATKYSIDKRKIGATSGRVIFHLIRCYREKNWQFLKSPILGLCQLRSHCRCYLFQSFQIFMIHLPRIRIKTIPSGFEQLLVSNPYQCRSSIEEIFINDAPAGFREIVFAFINDR